MQRLCRVTSKPSRIRTRPGAVLLGSLWHAHSEWTCFALALFLCEACLSTLDPTTKRPESFICAVNPMAGIPKTAHALFDKDALRKQLSGLGLVAFVGNGAILPRKLGCMRQLFKNRSPCLVRISVRKWIPSFKTGFGCLLYILSISSHMICTSSYWL